MPYTFFPAVAKVAAELRRIKSHFTADLAGAAELCLDADRCVDLGGLSREDYDAISGGSELFDAADRWAKEALRGLI